MILPSIKPLDTVVELAEEPRRRCGAAGRGEEGTCSRVSLTLTPSTCSPRARPVQPRSNSRPPWALIVRIIGGSSAIPVESVRDTWMKAHTQGTIRSRFLGRFRSDLGGVLNGSRLIPIKAKDAQKTRPETRKGAPKTSEECVPAERETHTQRAASDRDFSAVSGQIWVGF